MKKIFFIFIVLVASCSVGCKNKSQETNSSQNTSASSGIKCPNCGSDSYHKDETIPSMKICNSCGIGF